MIYNTKDMIARKPKINVPQIEDMIKNLHEAEMLIIKLREITADKEHNEEKDG